MGDEPRVVNRIPEEAPKPAVKKVSDLVWKVLKSLLVRQLMDKTEVLKDTVASFGRLRFKIDQAHRESQVELYFMDEQGKLSRPQTARDAFMLWEEKSPELFKKLADDLVKRERKMVDDPLKYEQGDYKRTMRVRAALGDAEKKWLDTRMTPTEQLIFYKTHELWKEPTEKGK